MEFSLLALLFLSMALVLATGVLVSRAPDRKDKSQR